MKEQPRWFTGPFLVSLCQLIVFKCFIPIVGKNSITRSFSEVLDTFKVKRSLSRTGCPYDNAVSKVTFKLFNTEFANQAHFSTGEQIAVGLSEYAHWFNHHRMDYRTPVQAEKCPDNFVKF
ncbi:hypothetical protein EBB07_15475 [Paenibacillaceae bacterium]|nr:hypothetical protein EBB07_15475 [Paenibacillaceae bacterium]